MKIRDLQLYKDKAAILTALGKEVTQPNLAEETGKTYHAVQSFFNRHPLAIEEVGLVKAPRASSVSEIPGLTLYVDAASFLRKRNLKVTRRNLAGRMRKTYTTVHWFFVRYPAAKKIVGLVNEVHSVLDYEKAIETAIEDDIDVWQDDIAEILGVKKGQAGVSRVLKRHPDLVAKFPRSLKLKTGKKRPKRALVGCAWPIGDPKDKDFHFCGAPVVRGSSYCAEHKGEARSPKNTPRSKGVKARL